jgi:ubiquinone/menaquinone biosynthesis C-methylase UbiE
VSAHEGARQERPFDPARAARLDDPARFTYLPIDEVVALIDAPQGAIVVDYGAGTGAYALPLAERRPDVRVVALDIQPEMLAMLREKPAFAKLGNVETVERVPDALRGTIARVYGINVLHELGDQALREIATLLRPEGRFIAIDWSAAVERPVGPPPERVYDPPEARERLTRLGFRVVDERRLRYQYALVAAPSQSGLPQP